MEQVKEKYYINDGELKLSAHYREIGSQGGMFVYEVLRVIKGVALFLEDHLARLETSCIKSGFQTLVTSEGIKAGICRLIKENQVTTGNIKILVNEWEGKVSRQAFFIPFHYPSDEIYLRGVELGILRAERENPEAKTIQYEVREQANQMIASGNFYEVLLIDNQGFVREGSRSNIFFIKAETIFTPPSAQVLNGITRQKVLKILQRDGFIVREEPIPSVNLGWFDAAFLTGTSPKVLPVSRIAGFSYQVGNSVSSCIKYQYDALIEEYILLHR